MQRRQALAHGPLHDGPAVPVRGVVRVQGVIHAAIGIMGQNHGLDIRVVENSPVGLVHQAPAVFAIIAEVFGHGGDIHEGRLAADGKDPDFLFAFQGLAQAGIKLLGVGIAKQGNVELPGRIFQRWLVGFVRIFAPFGKILGGAGHVRPHDWRFPAFQGRGPLKPGRQPVRLEHKMAAKAGRGKNGQKRKTHYFAFPVFSADWQAIIIKEKKGQGDCGKKQGGFCEAGHMFLAAGKNIGKGEQGPVPEIQLVGNQPHKNGRPIGKQEPVYGIERPGPDEQRNAANRQECQPGGPGL